MDKKGYLFLEMHEKYFRPQSTLLPLWGVDGYLNYHIFSPEDDWNRDIRGAPLMKHAWVCQEQIMVRMSHQLWVRICV
jgi:hypothetical protein